MPVAESVTFTKNCWFAKLAILRFNAIWAVPALVSRIADTLPVAVFVVVVVPVPVVVVGVAVTVVVVIVAAVTTPLPSVVSVIGFAMFNRPTQFKPLALRVAFKRLARKVKSELAVAPPSGDGLPWNSVMSRCKLGRATVTRFWQ